MLLYSTCYAQDHQRGSCQPHDGMSSCPSSVPETTTKQIIAESMPLLQELSRKKRLIPFELTLRICAVVRTLRSLATLRNCGPRERHQISPRYMYLDENIPLHTWVPRIGCIHHNTPLLNPPQSTRVRMCEVLQSHLVRRHGREINMEKFAGRKARVATMGSRHRRFQERGRKCTP
jgi:hypothetical protein